MQSRSAATERLFIAKVRQSAKLVVCADALPVERRRCCNSE